MINPQLIPYGTTLADPNPLAAPSLIQQPGAAGGIPQIPTGEVKTEYAPTTEYKTPSAGTRSAMSEADVAGDAEIEAKRRQQEAAVKQEQMEAGSLAAQAKIAEQKQAEIAELQRRRNEWVAAEEARRHAELEDFKKNTKSTTLFEDMTPTRRMLSALMVAGGQWAATMSGTGKNGAYEIFKDAEDNWRRTQEAQLKGRVEKMAAAGKSAKDMIDFFDKENDLIEKKYTARQDYALKALKSLQATIPTKSAQLDEAIAKAEKDNAINTRNFVTNFDTTTREQGTSTQTSTGDKSGGQQAADSSTKQAVITARETARSMTELGDFIKKNPDAWSEYQKAALAEAELEAAKQGNEKLISSMQGFGLAKVAIDQRLQSPEARRINAMIAPMITAKAREMDPVGALNKDAYINASKSLNLFTGPSEEVAGKAYDYADKNNRMADEYVRMTPALQRQEQAAPTQPTGKAGSPHRARGIPPEKQEAAISAADDFVAIRDSVKAKKTQLTATEQADTKEALETLKKNPTDAEAARYLRELRQRKGI